MTNLQLSLKKACEALNLDIEISFVLTLSDGSEIHALALIPQLGAPKGMMILSTFDDLLWRSEVREAGYGYSVLSELSPSRVIDMEGYIEMFSDWGWSSSQGEQPDWIIGDL